VTARTLRAAIAEDEPQARRTLRAYLDGVDWIELAGEASDGVSAVRLVDDLEPDLLFLDVRLPELTGLEVVQRIRHRPALVFTTAHDRFAVAAFELGALDYLLKPFGAERFSRMLERVRAHIDVPAAPDAVERTGWRCRPYPCGDCSRAAARASCRSPWRRSDGSRPRGTTRRSIARRAGSSFRSASWTFSRGSIRSASGRSTVRTS
jgi:CheY-like chemotaxis protein